MWLWINLFILLLCIVVLKKRLPGVVGKRFRKFSQRRSFQKFNELNAQICSSEDAYQNMNNDRLKSILNHNLQCEYIQQYFPNAKTAPSVEEFRSTIPIIKYSDIKEQIDRLCNGEKNILSVDPVYYFATSSGTTGAQKMIPITRKNLSDMQHLINGAGGAAMNYLIKNKDYKFTTLTKGATISFNPASHPKTAGGIPYGALSQGKPALPTLLRIVVDLAWKAMAINPFHLTDKVHDFETNFLIQTFFCVLDESISSFQIAFGSILSHFFSLIQLNFQEFIECIGKGSIDYCKTFVEHIPKLQRKEFDNYLTSKYSEKYRIKRALKLHEISTFKGFVGKIWPNLNYIAASVAGAFSIYEEKIRWFSGDVPIIGAVYLSSESCMGFQYNISGDYLFHPETSFFEFIPEDQIKSENPSTLLLSELEVGKNYELVVTTIGGFYRYRLGDVINVVGKLNGNEKIPFIKVCYRTGSLLDAFGEKTTENHIESALMKLAKAHDCTLTDFTCSLQLDESPVIYCIFAEFSKKLFNENDLLSAELDSYLCGIHPIYDDYRLKRKLGRLECFAFTEGKFSDFKQLLVETGTPFLQLKVPRLISKSAHLDFFSQKQK